MAKADRVPPVGRPLLGLSLVPGAGIAGDRIVFDQAVALAIGGQHLVGPLLDARIVLFQPRLVFAAARAVVGGDDQRRIRISRNLGKIAVARHSVGLGPGQHLFQGLSHHVQRSEVPGQRRRMQGDVGILVVAEPAGVAGGVVRKHTPAGIQLQHVQPVAAEAIETRIFVDAGHGRANRGYFEMVLHARFAHGRRRKRDFHEAATGFVPQRPDR